ncbi:hypothetical protein CLV63_108151 [Murinocardiopsis flavida]|uniref:Uncharacterized protein n=1 Tax=Murinocardiopsis flavida TaxID=645275 RepID=A0A2P8DJQ4_9ACTN|nr:hypothetical protein [Murinocardiopsis flavida]PSK97431.1 hypothetical protein CLV63_108151 [Murinocardiopsis flavida]
MLSPRRPGSARLQHSPGGTATDRGTRRADRGAGAVEYSSIIILVAAIFAGIVVVIPPGISNPVDDALCRLLSIFGDAECAKKEERDYAPDYCVRNAESQHGGFSVDIGFVTIGKDYRYAKETLSDGSVIVTFEPKTILGAVGGAGVQIGKKSAAGIEAAVEGRASGSYTPGETHIFKNEKEYKDFEDQLKGDYKDEIAKDLSPGYRFGRWALDKTGVVDDPDPRKPEIESHQVALSANLDAGLGANLGEPASKGRHAKPENKEAQPKWNLNLGVDGSVQTEGSAELAFWRNEPGNTKTATTYEWSGEGSLGANVGPKRYEEALRWKGGTRIMRNQDGSLKNIRYTTVMGKSSTDGTGGEGRRGDNSGGGMNKDVDETATTQSIQLNFETPEEQEAGEALLRDRGLLPPTNALTSLANPEMDDKEGGTLNKKPGPDAPPWEQVMYDKGTAWQYESDVQKDETELGAKAKLGLSVGADVSWGIDRRHTSKAQILGPPGPDGNRNFIDYPPCVYEGKGN